MPKKLSRKEIRDCEDPYTDLDGDTYCGLDSDDYAPGDDGKA